MPARSVDDLENLMPQDTKDRIEEQGIDILELKKQAQKSGYTPQVIFETTAGNREYKVWLKWILGLYKRKLRMERPIASL